MKNILRAFMILAAAIAAMSCEKAEPEGEKLNQNLSFTLKADNIEHNSARIVVSHNGSSTDTWYGFYVEGEVKSLGTEILKEIETLMEGDLAGALVTGTRKNINLRKLNPSTTYTYIAVGLSDKGEVYGTYNSVKFTTAREIPEFVETETWSIEYERGTFEDPTNGKEYPNTEIFHVVCEEGKYFYFDLLDYRWLDEYELTLADYLEMIVETVANNKEKGATVDQLLYMDTDNLCPANRLMWGDYGALVVGFDAELNPTGEYSIFNFTIVEDKVVEPGYSQWLGTWELPFKYNVYQTDDKGNYIFDDNGNRIVTEVKEATYEVTFNHIDNNYIYAMTGWEVYGHGFEVNLVDLFGLTGDYANGFPIEVYYNNGKLEFVATEIDAITVGNSSYMFGFFGLADFTKKGTEETPSNGLCAWTGMTMATASTEDGLHGTITGTSTEDNSYWIDYTDMGFIAYARDYITFNEPVKFPITMTKISDETVTAMSMTKKAATSKEDLLKRKSFGTKKAGKPIMLAR